MTLYELTEAAKELYALLENDEIDNQTFLDTLESIGTAEKLENYTYVQKQLESDYESYRKEKERLDKKMRACQNGIERMKTAVLDFMNCSGLKKAKAGTFNLSIREFESVNITDENKIHERWLKPQPPKIDKAAIKKALKEGLAVEGAEIVKKNSVIAR